jgi:cytochrome c-type biogenesis protein CcmF
VGSVLPTITEALTNQRFEAGPDWFDQVIGPQFAALVLVMGVCPLLGQAVGALRRLGKRAVVPVFGAALVPLGAALAGFTRPFSLIGFAFVGLAGGTAVAEIVRGVTARSRQGESVPAAVWRLFGRNRRRYGGYLVHVGVILMAVGVIGTRFYPFETEAVLTTGESIDVEQYTLVFEDLERDVLSDRVTTRALVSVYRDGRQLGTLGPKLDEYSTFRQTVAAPAVRAGIREDLYLVLAGWSDGATQATVKVFINPLASFLWLGGLVFMAGGAVAVWPSTRKGRVSEPAARTRRIWSTAGLIVGVVLLALAVWAMWGPAQGTAASASRSEQGGLGLAAGRGSRPRVGERAPDFSVDLLDGSTLSRSDLHGQVSVINFWSPECQPCEDELPDLQAIWEEYQDKGVAFLGVSFPDLEAGTREMVSEFGITYPNGLDAVMPVDYGITGVPETFVIGPQGSVAYVHIGPVTADRLRIELNTLVAE